MLTKKLENTIHKGAQRWTIVIEGLESLLQKDGK